MAATLTLLLPDVCRSESSVTAGKSSGDKMLNSKYAFLDRMEHR